MSPLLDLSQAKETGFDPVPSGVYTAEVFKVEMQETKGGENSKLPAGTPRMNIQFRLLNDPGQPGENEEAEFYNRRVFNGYIIAPEKIGGKKYEHKEMMDGMLLRFFKDIGYPEEEVKSGSFDPDFEDMIGRRCRVTIGQRSYKPAGGNEEDVVIQNEVKGTKPAGDDDGGSGLL